MNFSPFPFRTLRENRVTSYLPKPLAYEVLGVSPGRERHF